MWRCENCEPPRFASEVLKRTTTDEQLTMPVGEAYPAAA